MPKSAGVLVAGTTSDAGKTFVATGLCRALTRRGIPVQPFKAVNMSLNSIPADDGGEIAVAQWFQCLSARVPPRTLSNPVLLKSEGPGQVEVIVRGRSRYRLRSWREEMPKVLPDLRRTVAAAAHEAQREGKFIVAEGAGSPVEINLRRFDLSNFHTAGLLDLKVILVADLERGGSMAQVVGTLELLTPPERKRVVGIVLNRMRGDGRLLDSAARFLTRRTGIPVLGVIPYLEGLDFPAEDSLSLPAARSAARPPSPGGPRIGVLRYPHLSNFLDFPASWFDGATGVRWVETAHEVAALDLLILPGSRRTVDDLAWIRERGIDRAIEEAIPQGLHLIGVCGGYMILGDRLIDPEGFEGPRGSSEGLGLLPIATRFEDPKVSRRVRVRALPGLPTRMAAEELEGYEIRRGRTHRAPGSEAAFQLMLEGVPPEEQLDGAISPDGQIWGTAVHGILSQGAAWDALLHWLHYRPEPGTTATPEGTRTAKFSVHEQLEGTIERTADCLEEHLDIDRLLTAVDPALRRSTR